MTREEALNEIKSWAIPSEKGREVLKTLIPELAESEDERIRKELKEAFEAYDIESTWNGIPIRSVFAWLEKQKEQKPSQTDTEKEYVQTLKSLISDFLHGKQEIDTGYYQQIYDWLDGRHVEQKVLPGFDGLTPEEKMNHPLYLEGFDVGRDVQKVFDEQKPEWSEEDGEMLKMILGDLEWERRNTTFDKDIRLYDKKIAWLKSLRPSWKPSEEQINALYNVINPCDNVDKNALESLYKQLEKLI